MYVLCFEYVYKNGNRMIENECVSYSRFIVSSSIKDGIVELLQ